MLERVRGIPGVESAGVASTPVLPAGEYSTSLLQGLVFGVSPADRWSLLIAAVTLSVVGAPASLIPVGQADRINPIAALRHE